MDDLKKVLRTNQRYIDILNASDISSVKDLLQYFPRTYEDRKELLTLNQIVLPCKDAISVKGHITSKKMFPRGGKKIYDIKFEDELGNIGQISIYNAGFLASKIQIDKHYIIVGKPTFKFGRYIFSHPEIISAEGDNYNECYSREGPCHSRKDPCHSREGGNLGKELYMDSRLRGNDKKIGDGQVNNKLLHRQQDSQQPSEDYKSGRIYPVYSELNGIKPGRFAQKMRKVLPLIDETFKEYLPTEFLKKFKLLDVVNTIRNMHYPENLDMQKQAIHRVFFDRLLRIQLYSLINKEKYQEGKIVSKKVEIDWNVIKHLTDLLPFQLTNAQKKVVKTIIEDVHDTKPMLRLLQGDVGSGKTIVAAIAAYYIHKKFDGQSAFVAPLEILANQHFKTLAKQFLPLGLNIQLLTGAISKTEKDKIKQNLADGKIDVIVGTHAVLQKDIKFHNLQFAIIDEQHKFGVKQRSFFHKIGNPHILQMTATPIPRSMALAFFGEFDVSIIDELPKGRKAIYTKIISEKEYYKLKPRILTRIQQGQKIFIVTPLIEESEKLDDLKSATTEFEDVKNVFSEISEKVALIHGRMKSKEKDRIMTDFKSGKYNILVSTTVIEVGVDIPEATVMVIKNSERFGLSQLHQLRGRIGRNDMQAYCFLETAKKSGDTYKRLQNMEQTNDGFKLAELDLQSRGAGEILGTQQSGETDIPIEILSDMKFLEKVREGAERLLEKHPGLEGLGNLKEQLQEKVGGMLV